MCVVSNIGDNWREKTWPNIQPPFWPNTTQDEIIQLRKEIEELKKLLEAAKNYDEATGQKDCEMRDKVALIKEVARVVGVSVDDIFNKE